MVLPFFWNPVGCRGKTPDRSQNRRPEAVRKRHQNIKDVQFFWEMKKINRDLKVILNAREFFYEGVFLYRNAHKSGPSKPSGDGPIDFRV